MAAFDLSGPGGCLPQNPPRSDDGIAWCAPHAASAARVLLWRPDTEDNATIGVLEARLRARLQAPRLFVLPPGALSAEWRVFPNADVSPLTGAIGWGSSRVAALVDAKERAR